MMKLTEKSRRLLRWIYRGLGVTAVSMSFNACDCFFVKDAPVMYGMPPVILQEDIVICGYVRNQAGKGIPGIAIYVDEITTNYNYMTYSEGYFYFYVPKQENYTIIFTDIDGEKNGGNFKQYTIKLTLEEGAALTEDPLIVTLEEIDSDNNADDSE